MKKYAVPFALSVLMATVPLVAQANTQELNQVFDITQSENIQALELSNQEMKDTQGAILPFIAAIAVGGAFGAWSNHGITYLQTGNFASVNSTLYATGAGAIGGGYTNLMLRGAGIATSPFVTSAWKGSTGATNVFIRGNGAAIGYANAGIYKSR